jgi:predicted transcriptional regulator
MARMVRKQICIDEELDRRLGTLAGSRHISQSEVVRDALTAYFDEAEATRQTRIEAMERFLKQGEEIGKRLPPGWKPMTREEAHERGHFR